MTHLRQLQRISAYGLARDGESMLLVRAGNEWMLPGGGVEHGEHPAETVVREFAESAGLQVKVDRLIDVGSDHRQLPSGIDFHSVFAVFAVTVAGGALLDGPSWVPVAQLAETPMPDSLREILARSAS
jgi:8-oxo-dGTP diphosphatase